MKFLYYLKEAKTRTKRISEEEFIEGISTKCKQALKEAPIWRGVYGDSYDFGFIQPGKFTRKSANTLNWYTFLVNNSPTWKAYPKRSLICTFNQGTAEGYGGGNTYRVFPVDGANIGIAPNSDFWVSFKAAFNGGIRTLDDMNYAISTIFREATGKEVRDESWDHMKYYAKMVPDWFNKGKNWSVNFMNSAAADWLKDLKYNGSDFIKWLEKILDPDTNGFKHVKISSLPNLYSHNSECWTDADCYMINSKQSHILLDKSKLSADDIAWLKDQ